MKLWKLEPITPWEPWFDKAFGFVVRAETEQEARKFAAAEAGDEDAWRSDRDAPGWRSVWEQPGKTTCVPLTAEGKAEVVLRDFAAA
jgi:hypothetical protein